MDSLHCSTRLPGHHCLQAVHGKFYVFSLGFSGKSIRNDRLPKVRAAMRFSDEAHLQVVRLYENLDAFLLCGDEGYEACKEFYRKKPGTVPRALR